MTDIFNYCYNFNDKTLTALQKDQKTVTDSGKKIEELASRITTELEKEEKEKGEASGNAGDAASGSGNSGDSPSPSGGNSPKSTDPNSSTDRSGGGNSGDNSPRSGVKTIKKTPEEAKNGEEVYVDNVKYLKIDNRYLGRKQNGQYILYDIENHKTSEVSDVNIQIKLDDHFGEHTILFTPFSTPLHEITAKAADTATGKYMQTMNTKGNTTSKDTNTDGGFHKVVGGVNGKQMDTAAYAKDHSNKEDADKLTKAVKVYQDINGAICSAKMEICIKAFKDYMVLIREHVKSYVGTEKVANSSASATDYRHKPAPTGTAE